MRYRDCARFIPLEFLLQPGWLTSCQLADRDVQYREGPHDIQFFFRPSKFASAGNKSAWLSVCALTHLGARSSLWTGALTIGGCIKLTGACQFEIEYDFVLYGKQAAEQRVRLRAEIVWRSTNEPLTESRSGNPSTSRGSHISRL